MKSPYSEKFENLWFKGYRDDSLKAVERNQAEYGLPLKILSYKELYGWTMDEIVAKIGKKNNCTFCGVFRRQALERLDFFLYLFKFYHEKWFKNTIY